MEYEVSGSHSYKHLPVQEKSVNRQKWLLYSFITTSFDLSILLIAKLARGLLLQLVSNEAISIINMTQICENNIKLPVSTKQVISEKDIPRHTKICTNTIIRSPAPFNEHLFYHPLISGDKASFLWARLWLRSQSQKYFRFRVNKCRS